MLAGAFCMVVGAGLYVVGIQAVTPWVFAVGAVSFAVIQMQQTYAGRNITIKRLRRIMTFGDILFILSALLMLENTYRFILPLFTTYLQNGYYQYVTYINNNWDYSAANCQPWSVPSDDSVKMYPSVRETGSGSGN